MLGIVGDMIGVLNFWGLGRVVLIGRRLFSLGMEGEWFVMCVMGVGEVFRFGVLFIFFVFFFSCLIFIFKLDNFFFVNIIFFKF